MNPPRVLIVEDDREVGELLQEILDEFSISSELAMSGQRVLEKARACRPAVVLLDLGLPSQDDGYRVLHQLKSDPTTRGIPVIMLTGTRLEEGERLAFEAGADGYISKPFELDELDEKLRRFIHPTCGS